MGTAVELVKVNTEAIEKIKNDPQFWWRFTGSHVEWAAQPYQYAPKEPFYLYLDKLWKYLHYLLCPNEEAQHTGIFFEESPHPLVWTLAGRNRIAPLDELAEFPVRYNTIEDIKQILQAMKQVKFEEWEQICLNPPFESSQWIAKSALRSLAYLQEMFGWIYTFYEQAVEENVCVYIRAG